MPEVTKIGYFLTDLIKKVDFLGTRCICNLTIYVANCTHGCSAERGCPRRSRDTRRLWTSSSARRQTPDPRHRSGWVMAKQSNTRPATQVRLTGGRTPDLRHRSGWVMVKQSNTRPATQVRWWNTRPATQVRFAKNESPSTKYTAWRSGSLSSDGHPWPTAVAHQ